MEYITKWRVLRKWIIFYSLSNTNIRTIVTDYLDRADKMISFIKELNT
jgi:hypothetical protein